MEHHPSIKENHNNDIVKDDEHDENETQNKAKIKVYSARKIHMVGWVGGFLSGYIPTSGLHLAGWSLPDSQLS